MSKLAEALKKINSKSSVVGGYHEVPHESGAISTGLIAIDRNFRDGGLPRGRWTQVYGEENAGKSTLLLGMIAKLHEDWDSGKVPRGRVLFMNCENAFDEDYARDLGVHVDDPDKFLISAPDDGMDAIDVMEQMVGTGEIDMVVLDSLTFMVPRAMLEQEVDKTKQPATFARQNSLFVRRMTGRLARTNTAMVVINHLVGTMQQDFHGNVIKNPGGGDMIQRASSVKLRLSKKGRPLGADGKPVSSADINESVASATTVRIEKNKRGRQYLDVDLRLEFENGFDRIFDTFETATEAGIIVANGARYSYADTKWHGQQNVLDGLKGNPELFEQVRAATRAHYGLT